MSAKRKPITPSEISNLTKVFCSKFLSESREKNIISFCNIIYDSLIIFANTNKKNNTKFEYPVTTEHINWNNDGFFDKNRKAIFAKLEEYFPGCSIRCKTFCRNAKGNLYDISHWNPEKFTESHYKTNRSFITIDWSNTVGY